MIEIENGTRLSVDVIRTDGATQARVGLNQSHIEELAELLREGLVFKDSVVVFYDGTDYWLGDGFHRINATKQAGLTTISTDVRPGTREDAMEYACSANADHGLRRTNDDKRNAVVLLFSLPKWQKKSNREIARKCGVTEHLVRIVRSELPDYHPSATRSQNPVKPPVEPVEEVVQCVKLRTPYEVVEQWFSDYPTLEHLSNREIARRCGVTEGTVRNYKKELQEERERVAQEQAEAEVTEVVEQEPIIEIVPDPEPEPVVDVDPEQPAEPLHILLSANGTGSVVDAIESIAPAFSDIDATATYEVEQEQEPAISETEYVSIDDVFPGYSEWKEEHTPVAADVEEPEPAVQDEEDEELDEITAFESTPQIQPEPEPEPDILPAIEPEIVPEPEPVNTPESPEAPIEVEEQTPAEPVDLQMAEAKAVIERNRELKREQQQERIEQLRSKGVALPTGKYSCIVIDPPWQMQKIERDERPNQVEFDYPTMSEDELKAFDLPALSADDCHLYLWTTQKHLPLALRLAEHWGFKYQCLMTWVKNVGFTPFSWMYTTEHVLFCTKGSLPLLAIGRRLDFGGKVREHSRKPDEFYNIVREVSPGPRIDVFSREKRNGFDQYGNEVEKYVQAG
jgi:N6-adenosine-specific RNA methylase IME4